MYAKTALDRPTLNACDSFGHLCCYLVSHGDPNAGSGKSCMHHQIYVSTHQVLRISDAATEPQTDK